MRIFAYVILIAFSGGMSGCATLPQETVDASREMSVALQTISDSIDTVFEDYLETKWQVYLAKHRADTWKKVTEAMHAHFSSVAGTAPNAYTMTVEEERLVGHVQEIVDDDIYEKLELALAAEREKFQMDVVIRLNQSIADNLAANRKLGLKVTGFTKQALNVISLGSLVKVGDVVDDFVSSGMFTLIVETADQI